MAAVLNDNIEPDPISSGPLDQMLDEAVRAVKSAPRSAHLRLAYADALILAGDLPRADAQARLAAALAPEFATGIARLRGEIRGMDARRAWFETGARPSFPGGATEADRAGLGLGAAIRAGDADAADAALDALEAARKPCPARLDDTPYEDLRDLDDRIPHALEAITAAGAYLWLDLTRVVSVTMAPPARPRHLAYVRAHVTLVDGAGDVLLPATYWDAESTAAQRLARETDWVGGPGRAVLGRGQRCLLAGPTDWGFLAIRRIEIGAAA